MRTKKALLFHREAKMQENGQKQTKKGYSVNPPSLVQYAQTALG